MLKFLEGLDDRTKVLSLLSAIFAYYLYIAFHYDGTGDSGDAVFHFQIAEGAFKHPELYLDHWGKPLYTLLASPFAQFGYRGIKVFNILTTVGAYYMTYLCARRLNIGNAWAVPVFMVGMPLWLNLTFSGLTEPLSALLLVSAIYLSLNDKTLAYGLLLVSFLPFVRSEGLIMLCIFTLYLTYRGRFALLPLLAFGHIVYGIIGFFFVHHDFWWVINQIPYATTESTYGSGVWYQFLKHTYDHIERINTLFFIIGTAVLLRRWLPFKFWKDVEGGKLLFLVYGCLSALIVGHTLFWLLGIFKSFGLARVLITIMPELALVILIGFDATSKWLERYVKSYLSLVQIAVLLLVFYLPFKVQKAGGEHWLLTGDQRLAEQAADYIRTNVPDYEHYLYYYEMPYFGVAMHQDRFNPQSVKRYPDIHTFDNPPLQHTLIIWESWYAVNDAKVREEQLDKMQFLKKLTAIASPAIFSPDDANHRIAVYSVEPPPMPSEERIPESPDHIGEAQGNKYTPIKKH